MRRFVLVTVLGALASSPAAAAPQTPLAGLVVPRSELGHAAAGFQVELISGEVSKRARRERLLRPGRHRGLVDQGGPVSGFRLIYGDPGFGALRRGRGLIDIGTSLDYFKSTKQASAYEEKTIRDLRRARGQNLGGGVLERVSTFLVRGLSCRKPEVGLEPTTC